MDKVRKGLLRAGVYLGDINLALASVRKEIPSYARGIDGEALIADIPESSQIDGEIDRWMSSGRTDSLDHGLVRLILDRAISNGRFLSAIRCLEILGERDSHVDKLIRQGVKEVLDGNFGNAAHLFVIASNLSLNEGIPLFQYSASDLHSECTSNPENCVTARPLVEAIEMGLDYLLGSRRVYEQVKQIETIEAKSKLLVAIAVERDPDALRFLEVYKRSNQMIEELSSSLDAIVEKLMHVSSLISQALRSIQSKGYHNDVIFSKLRRIVMGLARDLEQISDLGKNWQFSRIRDRLLRLLESADEAGRISEGRGFSEIVQGILESAELVRKDNIIGEIDRIESGLRDSQNLMLGRKVPTDEHWQFLREIGFKHPVAPLMCCIARFNRSWLVVPRWQGPLATLLREGFESTSRFSP